MPTAVTPINEVTAFLARRPSVGELAEFHLSDAAQTTLSNLLEKARGASLGTAERQLLGELTAMRDLAAALRSRVLPSVRTSQTTSDPA